MFQLKCIEDRTNCDILFQIIIFKAIVATEVPLKRGVKFNDIVLKLYTAKLLMLSKNCQIIKCPNPKKLNTRKIENANVGHCWKQ